MLAAREAGQVAAAKSAANDGLAQDAACEAAGLALISGGAELLLAYRTPESVAATLREMALQVESNRGPLNG